MLHMAIVAAIMIAADTLIIGVYEHGVLPAVAAGPDPVVSDLLWRGHRGDVEPLR